MVYIVSNIPNTSKEIPPSWCSCWLEYWERKKQQKAYRCAKCGATHDLVGAHVYCRTENGEVATFIVPLCDSCNHIASHQMFEVYLEPVFLR